MLVDTQITQKLLKSELCQQISRQVDEVEHSLEMQYPFIQYALKLEGKEKDVKIVPIMVGELDDEEKQDE